MITKQHKLKSCSNYILHYHKRELLFFGKLSNNFTGQGLLLWWSQCLLTRKDLPVLHQLLPDDLPHDLLADAEQLGDGGVRVVEAVQQNL